MTLENIGNDNLTLSHEPASVITGGTFGIVSAPSQKVKCGAGLQDLSGVHVDQLQFSFSGGSAPGFLDGSVFATPASAIIPATAQKTKARAGDIPNDMALVIREGDRVTATFVGTIEPPPTPPAPPTATITGGVYISNSGQTKAKAQ